MLDCRSLAWNFVCFSSGTRPVGLVGEFVSNPSQATHSLVQKGRSPPPQKKKNLSSFLYFFCRPSKGTQSHLTEEPAAPPSVSLGFHLIFQSWHLWISCEKPEHGTLRSGTKISLDRFMNWPYDLSQVRRLEIFSVGLYSHTNLN